MLFLYESFGSRVSSNFVLVFMVSVVLFICNASCVLYSAGSDVCISCRYD